MKIIYYLNILLFLFSLPLIGVTWTVSNYTGENNINLIFNLTRGGLGDILNQSETKYFNFDSCIRGAFIGVVQGGSIKKQSDVSLMSSDGKTVKNYSDVGCSDQNLMLYKDSNGYKLMATPGSYSKTCSNCTYDGFALKCDCKTKKGSWHHTEIPANACKSFKNDDGNLKCE